jgi:hypothetical protein
MITFSMQINQKEYLGYVCVCVCVCAYLNLKIYLKVSLSTPIMYPRSHYKLKFIFCLLEIDPFQYLESN